MVSYLVLFNDLTVFIRIRKDNFLGNCADQWVKLASVSPSISTKDVSNFFRNDQTIENKPRSLGRKYTSSNEFYAGYYLFGNPNSGIAGAKLPALRLVLQSVMQWAYLQKLKIGQALSLILQREWQVASSDYLLTFCRSSWWKQFWDGM